VVDGNLTTAIQYTPGEKGVWDDVNSWEKTEKCMNSYDSEDVK